MPCVPTIFEQDGYRVMVYTRNEHPPPHVHVRHAGTDIAIAISRSGARYMKSSGRRPTEREIRRAVQIVQEHLKQCLTAWNSYHA
jgi:DNA-directed RNA polymerase specialized sigma subunit